MRSFLAVDCRAVETASLPDRHRDALTHVHLQQESVREFAERTGITANTAAVRLHRARAALRALMDKSEAASICANQNQTVANQNGAVANQNQAVAPSMSIK